MVPDPVLASLAIALIFGAISSAMLLVFVMPLLYQCMVSGEIDALYK